MSNHVLPHNNKKRKEKRKERNKMATNDSASTIHNTGHMLK